MALDYSRTDQLYELLKLQETYVQWQIGVTRALLLKQDVHLPFPPRVLDVVPDEMKVLCTSEMLEALDKANNSLFAFSFEGAVAADFLERFQLFASELGAFRVYVFLTYGGFEALSGLKNKTEMQKDLRLEMSRLERHGQGFSLAIAEIDGFAEMKAQLDAEDLVRLVKTAGNIISQSLRPSDDAYYIGENEFVLCLRQTDSSGGVKAFERFKVTLEEEGAHYSLNGVEKKMTMSCCVAEVVSGCNIDELLENLRYDMDAAEQKQGVAFSFHELSPLQRFIESQ